MNASHNAPLRQSVAAFAMAATMALGLLSSMGLIADRYHAGEVFAQGAAPLAQQAVAASSDSRS